MSECRRLGIKVLPPDINRSKALFAIEKDNGATAIRFGLTAIKNVGLGAIEPIISEREQGGPYKSVEDLSRRANLSGVNRRVLESLIRAGALDCLGDRGTLNANVTRILDLYQRQARLRETGQSTMFDLWGQTVDTPLPGLEMEPAAVPSTDKLKWEKELTGVYLSEHPFSPYVSRAAADDTVLCGQVDREMEGQVVRVAGMVASIHPILTRDGQTSAAVTLEDLDGSIEVMVWSRVYNPTKELWQEGNIVLVEGKVRERADQMQVTCDRATRYELNAPPLPRAPLRETEDRPQPAGKPETPEAAKTEKAPRPNLKKETQKKETVKEEMPLPESTPKPVERKRLIITLQQTEDAAGDIARLHQIMALFQDYPGSDELSLVVSNGTKVFKLKMGQIRIGYCDDLRRRLGHLIGDDG